MSRSSCYIWLSRRWKRPWLRPCITRAQVVSRCTVTLSYLFLALGISVPLPTGKSAGQPYPCMNHRCGCQSAEECWRNCCCMTLEERLIWARENHVIPPDYALAAARAQGIEWAAYWPRDSGQPDSNQAVSFQSSPEQAVCQEQSGSDSDCGSAVCDCPRCACQRCAGKTTCKESRPLSGFLLIAAMKCHGIGDNWQGLSISLSPPAIFRFQSRIDVVEQITLIAQRFSSISFPPAVPPPRWISAVHSLS
jgi:hypothetical protein